MTELAELYVEIKANRLVLNSLISKQTIDESGTGTDKGIKRKEVITDTVMASKRLVAYAMNKEDAVMLTEVKVVESDLKRLADTTLAGVAEGINSLALKYATETLSLGNTPATGDALAAKIVAYRKTLTQPKLSIDELK